VAGSLRSIFAIAEAYPDLHAMESFRELQRTLSDVEDHLQNARRYYNAVVRDLNTAIAQFPSSLVAGCCGSRAGVLGLDDGSERAVPEVRVGAGE